MVEAIAQFEPHYGKSGGGPPQSKALARYPAMPNMREASWSAPVLWRFR
jgi:hypothetical protein